MGGITIFNEKPFWYMGKSHIYQNPWPVSLGGWHFGRHFGLKLKARLVYPVPQVLGMKSIGSTDGFRSVALFFSLVGG